MEEILEKSPSTLDRKRHIHKLIEAIRGPLPRNYVPSQTWIVYWIAHSLSLLGQPDRIKDILDDVIAFLAECADPGGGYGGGPGQIPHLATTYAAVNALITMSSDEALESIERDSLVKFLRRMKQPDGSFSMHDDGEIDSRATYCALSILRCLNIQDSILLENIAEWILSCQTYEGGFGSVPGSEAHGGYTFCCVASLRLLNQLHMADIPSLLRWLINKQMTHDGGFCGRSNKLVDSCYSYWQGAIFQLIHPYVCKQSPNLPKTGKNSEKTRENIPSRRTTRSSSKEDEATPDHHSKYDPGLPHDIVTNNWLMDCGALQDYILNQCQDNGGLLRDKPGTNPDYYHTCYALSGLSISQHQPDGSMFDIGANPINILMPTHPLFNLTFDNLKNCFEYFENKSVQMLEENK